MVKGKIFLDDINSFPLKKSEESDETTLNIFSITQN